MKKSEKHHLESWFRTREKGRKRYAINTTLITTALILLLKLMEYFTFNLNGYESILNVLIFTGCFWLILGYLMNYFWIWSLNEEKYNRLLKKQAQELQSSEESN